MKKEEEKNDDANEAEVFAAYDVYLMNTEPIKKKKKVVRRKKKRGAKAVDIDHFRAENLKQYQKNAYNKQSNISQELANFMGIIHQGSITTLTRKEVTTYIMGYIKRNHLIDRKYGRQINPDIKLKTLLKIPVGEQLTFFNLQKYLRPHLF